MTRLRFTKMQGLGNDFVVLDGVRQQVALTPAQLRRLADRRFGVGCDQVLVVEKATRPDVDFRYRIFNADGGEVEQCGNGARCFVKFVRDQGLTDKREIRVETAGGVIVPELDDDGAGRPSTWACRASRPPTSRSSQPAMRRCSRSTSTARRSRSPRCRWATRTPCRSSPTSTRAPVTTQGPRIEHHPRFPQRVNAGYMQVVDRANIRLRVWERGAGETLACGTGACAAVVAGIRRGLLDADGARDDARRRAD